jgi:hypothetical protein
MKLMEKKKKKSSKKTKTSKKGGAIPEPRSLIETEPFIENDKFWKKLPNGDQVPSCDNTQIQCFPYNINSTVPCLPSCIFTDNKGRDEYTGFDHFLKGKTPKEQKTIIITYGPPASGKGSLQKVFEELEISNDNIVDVNVDMIFQYTSKKETPDTTHEKDKKDKKDEKDVLGDRYKKQLEAIKLRYQDETPEEIKKYTQRLYSYYRWVADQISDMLLYKAMLSNLDIKWETAGGADQEYVKSFITDKIEKGYKVVIIYPVVSKGNLMQRIKERESQTGQEGATEKKIIEMINNAKKGIIKLDRFNREKKRDQIDIIILNNDAKGQQLSIEKNLLYRSNQGKKLTDTLLEHF